MMWGVALNWSTQLQALKQGLLSEHTMTQLLEDSLYNFLNKIHDDTTAHAQKVGCTCDNCTTHAQLHDQCTQLFKYVISLFSGPPAVPVEHQ